AGGERNLRLLSLGDQAIIEGLEYGVVPCRGPETSHVEEVANLAASALDVPTAPPLAAIVIVRSHPQQGGGDIVAHLAEYRHRRDQGGGRGLAEPRHALDDLSELRKTRRGLDHGRDRSLELGYFEGDPLQETRLRL